MARFASKTVVVSLAVAGLLATTLAPSTAHAARLNTAHMVRLASVLTNTGITTADCHIINVQLNGDQPASVSCGLTQDAARRQTAVSPDTGVTTSCSDGNALELFDNVGYDRNGSMLCLSGNGSINLADQLFNDMMSSWKSYQQEGKVYWNDGDTGASFSFARNQGNPNVGSGWNDQASSVCINDNTGAAGCP